MTIIEQWNAWRKDNSQEIINLRSAYLRDANLRDANLQGADLRSADLRSADLRSADLRDAYLQGANLRDANLQGAYLRDAYLRDANLRDANLQGAYLRDAYLQGVYLQGADLRDANLQGAYLRDAYLQGAYLQGAYLFKTNVANTCLDPENKPNADIEGFALDGEYAIGYRTRKARHIDKYRDGRVYSADWFSTADTECHPGLYVWPTLTQAQSWAPEQAIIQVKFRIVDLHKVGNKWRVRGFLVLGGVPQEKMFVNP